MWNKFMKLRRIVAHQSTRRDEGFLICVVALIKIKPFSNNKMSNSWQRTQLEINIYFN